ncbi:MAG: TIR domain-containing protein, partial [Anaerolineae bacterium]|nr:TIR domain-containing protein [Anaerolineae bacterium]
MPPVKKSKVFISYSRKDTQIADSLARDLTSVGIDVWMDRDGIEVGERWSTAVQNALETSQAMVLVLSPDSMNSTNVEDEFTYFLDNNKPIVPIMVRPTRLHFQLHRLQWVDFTGDRPEDAYERLMRALAQVGVEFRTVSNAGEKSRLVSLIDTIYVEQRQSRQRRRFMSIASGVLALLVIAAILIGMMLLSDKDEPEGIQSAENVPARVLNPQDVPVFRQPSRDSGLVSAKSDELVFVRRRTPDNRFVLVTVGNGEKEGWIQSENVELLDEEVNAISEIAVFVSPTPTPSLTPSPFLTATPTLTPSPSPEVVLNPNT